MSAPPTVLVTGGEGLVGSVVVRHLLAAGHAVTTLTRPGVEPHAGVRVVVGDARDPDAVRTAAEGVEAVAHLAAIPNPFESPAVEVFGNNAVATFTVLWTAAESGIRRFAIAGSVNATGLLMNPHHPLPARFPVDETTPADLADPYSLSKAVDELTLATVCRRFGASGVALRLPLVLTAGNAARLRAWQATRPGESIGDGWGWLDARDAAEAFRLALLREGAGAEVVHVAAGETLQPEPTDALLDRYAAGVPRDRPFPGREAPVDTRRARTVLGFSPRYEDPGALDAEEGR